jgi:hypothetical protein
VRSVIDQGSVGPMKGPRSPARTIEPATKAGLARQSLPSYLKDTLILPGFRARADQLDYIVNALGHRILPCRSQSKIEVSNYAAAALAACGRKVRGVKPAPALSYPLNRWLLPLVDGVSGILFSEALAAEGEVVFVKVCELGLEGIVSKREGSFYKIGRSRSWLKTINPDFVRI